MNPVVCAVDNFLFLLTTKDNKENHPVKLLCYNTISNQWSYRSDPGSFLMGTTGWYIHLDCLSTRLVYMKCFYYKKYLSTIILTYFICQSGIVKVYRTQTAHCWQVRRGRRGQNWTWVSTSRVVKEVLFHCQ